ncbi:uncharacterized protein [Miscanthus floridulus]|uniref:uncharacterized protein n=1 Tax=Miscanthus floridulus TaxID=154761 RepID=UPI00345B30E0
MPAPAVAALHSTATRWNPNHANPFCTGSWDILSFRKFESGNDKRKRKRHVDALIESQRGSIDKFFKSSIAASTNPDELAIVALDEPTNENEEENVDIGVDDNNFYKKVEFLLKHVPSLTVKSLSNTHWESRIKSVSAIRYQATELRIKVMQKKIFDALGNFEFILGMVIWNKVSKKLQSPDMCIDSTLQQIQGMMQYFETYRNEGFSSSLIITKGIASDMGVEASFPVKCRATRKKQFDESNCQEEILEPEKAFEVKYFLAVVDMARTSLKNRFEELIEFKDIFGFLMRSSTLKSLDDIELEECCTKFAKKNSADGSCDVEVHDLISELKILKFTLPEGALSAMEIFEHVREVDCYPNISIAYRILFTVPVTVASAERSFSKLKLLKNYLRSTMSQERLNGLATLCIEKKLLDEIDINSIINDFASRNVRRNCLR